MTNHYRPPDPISPRDDCVGRQLAVLLSHGNYQRAHDLIDQQRRLAAGDRRAIGCPCGLAVADLGLPPQILGVLETASILWTDQLIEMLRYHEREMMELPHVGPIIMERLWAAIRPFLEKSGC